MKLDPVLVTDLAWLLKGVMAREDQKRVPACYSPTSMAIYEHQIGGAVESASEKGDANGTIA